MHDNLLATADENRNPGRDFTADAPNVKWLTAVTWHPPAEGKLYLCAIKDYDSGRIVGYSTDSRMNASPATSALRNAIVLRNPDGTIVHSDKGSLLTCKFVQTMKSNGLLGPTGREPRRQGPTASYSP